MGWEFAASWLDEPAKSWMWTWRRIADDSGLVLEESTEFTSLDDCIEDARAHGFDHTSCGPTE